MIGVLRPQSTPSGSNYSSRKSGGLVEGRRETKSNNILAPEGCDDARHLATYTLAEDPDGDPVSVTKSTSPGIIGGHSNGAYFSRGDKPARPQLRPRRLAVAVVQSTSDGHQVKALDNHAEVGTICVAVVHHGLKRDSRTNVGTAGPGATILNTNVSAFGATGQPPCSASAGALRKIARRCVQLFAPRAAGWEAHGSKDARLVLYCKLPGGVIIAVPLDRSAFCLREDVGTVESNRSVAQEATDGTQQMSWTLPEEGFEALCDLENSVVPGLPALARDMARDSNCVVNKSGGVARPLAEEISLRISGDNEEQQNYVVIPRVAGIVFARLGPAGPRAATGGRPSDIGSSGRACIRASAVIARLEQGGGTGTMRQWFVLEELDVFRGDDDLRDTKIRTNSRISFERASARKNAKRVSLPVAYATLLEEATSLSASPGGKKKYFRTWSRWRRGRKYQAGANQVVPDLGEDTGFERERGECLLGPEKPVREDRRIAGSRKPSQHDPPSATAPRAGGVSSRRQPEEPHHALTVRGVQAASLDQAIRWASTRDVVWAVLAAACRPEDGDCRAATETRGDAAQTTAVCAAGAACALLARVFGNGTPEHKRGTAGISEKEAPIVMGRWWEGFCAAAAPFCGDDGGEKGTLPLLREAPRLLLEGMLEIPAVETAFLERGLARHLADVLRVALVQMKSAQEEEQFCDHQSTGYPSTGAASPCGMTKLPDGDANASGPSHGTIGAILRPIQAEGGPSPSPEANPREQRLAWWLLFNHRRGKACDRSSGHAFEDALKTGEGSADGGSTVVDGRSGRTVSGEIKGEGISRGPDTSRKYDPSDGLHIAAGNDSLGSESVPTPSISEHREREGVAKRRTGHGADVAHRERISPPMLRLDALDSILANKEWGSPRGNSQRAAVTLSTASTRAAPEHLPTFLSARGATSRASARHGSGRSLRTGRTTQRDSTASTGYPTVRSVSPTVATDVDAAASRLLPLPSPQALWSNGGDPVRCGDGRGGEGEVGSGGSNGGGDRESCGASGGERCGGGGVSVGPRAVSGGGTIPSVVEQAPFETDGSDIIEDDDDENLLHNADTADAVVPVTHCGGYTSVRKDMPCLSLEEIPATRMAAAATSTAFDRDSPGKSGTPSAQGSPCGSPASPKESPAARYAEHNTEPGGENPALSRPVVDAGRRYSAKYDPHRAAKNGALDQVDLTAACRPGSTPSANGTAGDTFEGRFDGIPSENHPPAVEVSGRVDHGSLRALPTYGSPAALVVDLARASARGLAPLSSPSQARQKRQLPAHVLEAAVATAKMLLSLLPSTSVEHDPEGSLVAALEVLSFVGALSWTDDNAWATTPVTTTCGGKPAVVGHTGGVDAGPDDTRREPSVWPLELDDVGIALLARAGEVHLDRRLSALRRQCHRTGHDESGEEMASQSHRSHVHNACRLGLECGWITRLLLRRVRAAGAFNSEWRSVLSAEQTVDALRFCGRAFEMLQRGFRCTCSSGASYDSGRSDDKQEVQEGSPEVRQGCSGHAAESLLLTAPAAVDLARLVVVLVRQPAAWGENPAWAALTLGSVASCLNGEGAIVPVLVDLLNQMVSVTPTEDEEASQGVRAEPGQHQRQAHDRRTLLEGAQALERRLTGGGTVLDELVFSLLDSSAAIVRRAGTLLETLQETSESAVSGRVDKGKTEETKAAALVAREMAPIFRRDGTILTMMTTPLRSRPSIEVATDTPAAALYKRPHVGSPISAPCLAAAAAVRLSAEYFSLFGKTAIREDQDLVRLEAFVDPLFSLFHKEWEALVEHPERSHEAPSSERGRRAACAARDEPKTEEEGTGARRRGGVLLCRLHLEALAELAAVQDPAVRKRLEDCCVAPFLVQRVLGVGDDAAGTMQEESPRHIHGSVDSSSCCDATVTSRSSLSCSPSAEHLSSVNGSGITPPTHQVAKKDAAETGGTSSSSSGRFHDLRRACFRPNSAVAGDAATSLSVGDRVDGLVSVKRGRPRWFPGRVAGINGDDGTVHVCFDDGDEEPRKDPAEVRPSRRRSTERVKGRSRSTLSRPSGGGSVAGAGAAVGAPAASDTQKGGHQLATTNKRSKPRVSSKPNPDVTDGVIPPPATQSKRFDDVAGEACSSHGSRIAHVEGEIRRSARAGGDTTTVFEGGADVPTTAVAAADGGNGAAEADSEDDDAYFVIHSVLDDATAANNNGRPLARVDSAASMSVVPRIDLQSPVFRTRVSSSQLGPGSSLSTPTTGGARILDTVRGAAGSRSEASLSTAVFPSGRSSRVLRPPLFTDRSSVIGGGGGGSSSRGFSMVRSASVLTDTCPPMADSGGRVVTEREITELLRTDGESSSDDEEEEEEEEEEKQEKGVPSPKAGSSRSPQQLPERSRHEAETDNDCDLGKGDHPPGGKRMSEEEVVRLRDDGKKKQVFPLVNYENDLSVLQRYAVELLLCMATAPRGHGDSPVWEHALPLASAGGSVEVASLRAFFDSDRNAHIVPSLRAQWRPEVAVLAKIVCAALFDAQSYSLDGDHIGAGRFGGVIVSECPLPLGGGRHHLASAQASAKLSYAGKEGGLESPTRLVESSLSVPPRRPQSDCEQDEVALKVIERDDLDGAVGQNVFLEALALRALADVPGVCRLYDFGVTPTSYVLVLERCACSLKDWRSARSDNDEDDLCASPCAPRSDTEVALYLAVFRQIVAAVHAMAARGVIHFDLKCDNVLVRGGGSKTEYHECLASSPTAAGFRTALAMEQDIVPSVCVADFGEAIVGRRRRCGPQETNTLPAAAGPDPGSTAGGDGFYFDVRGSRGTERIQSPEMVFLSGRGGGTGGGGPSSADPDVGAERGESAGGITTASDVWSLGCLLYELLSKQPLFRDLQWSEFFVTLTAGEVFSGNGTVPVAEGASVPPLPPPLSLHPFAALGCAKAVKTLLEAMLVRNPAKRPSALRVVSVVDEALTAVVCSLPVGSENHPPTTTARPRPKNQSATSVGAAVANTHSMPRGQRNSPGGETSQVEHQTEVVAHSARESGAQATTEAAGGRTPLHPSMAVAALRSFAAKQSAVLGCDGCLHRLGTGAFLLALSGPTDGGGGGGDCIRGKSEDLAACPARQQLGSETTVCCNTAVWRGCCVGAAAGGTSALEVDEIVPLGVVLPVLGISHVVCVDTTYGNPATSMQQSDSQAPGKPRILRVSVRMEKDGSQEEIGGASPSSSAAKLIRDVAEFATGPRVLFVGVGGGCGGEAGAVAIVWAMERTGKGAYETMLDFRQACAGFWVDTATLKSVLG